MRQKELRLALVCYGGISLAVYMHGVTKEIWRVARASRAFHAGEQPDGGVEAVYRALLDEIAATRSLRLRVIPDIVAGASAGGINGVFLAQALTSGQSLEPLTRLWLDKADVDALLDPDAAPWSRIAKFWAMPLVWGVLRRPGNPVSRSVAPGTRAEVRRKVSRLIRARWFQPPFGGIGFSRLIDDALAAMQAGGGSPPLLPPGHPLDLLVTATDFHGHAEAIRLNSPPLVEETEHRLPIGFRAAAPGCEPVDLAVRAELVMAARATASFPGAFPPLAVGEIDRLVAERGYEWPGRDGFLARIMPRRWQRGDVAAAALVDGAVLVNRPFAEAMAVLPDRPSQREVDRRMVYIDPRPESIHHSERTSAGVGFLSAIVGSLSAIPREQPIRDNLESLRDLSDRRARLGAIVEALRPEIEESVEALFGYTLFLDRPTPKRLAAWRNRAQQAAAEQAGFTFHAYAQAKFDGNVRALAQTLCTASPEAGDPEAIEAALRRHLRGEGLDQLADRRGGANEAAIGFFRAHDLAFRIRRLKLMARRLAHDWTDFGEIAPEARQAARDAVFRAQAMYQAREPARALGAGVALAAARVIEDPGSALAALAATRDLTGLDLAVDALMVEALEAMDKPLRRRVLLAYLGFPFYDVATLPLLQGEGLNEFDPVKVDRISAEDAASIRPGGTMACLRGVEFFNFGAFFSRAYRENDYLWGRLHGAERMIDIIASSVEDPLDPLTIRRFKRDAFRAVLAEEKGRLEAEPGLVDRIGEEVSRAFTDLETGTPGAEKS